MIDRQLARAAVASLGLILLIVVLAMLAPRQTPASVPLPVPESPIE